jgi:prepilin-type N-terminal cleavage/methylation domain-containing protein
MSNPKQRNGFTIVELLVVIVVIAILATISIVSYGAWKKQAATAQVKSDLNAVAAAMESARTFGNGYPQSPLATTLTAFSPSNGVVVSGGGAVDGLSYCVDGTSSQDATVQYYVASETKDQGPLSGTCATRPTLPAPGIPTNLAVTSGIGTAVGLSWSASTNAATYTAQCASDAGFITGVQSTTTAALTITVSGLTPSSSYFCRVNAVNANSTSAWSSQVSTTTSTAYGSLAVATSIEGYWTAPPQGFLLEDGSAVSRTVYSDLFAVIGTTYGTGDGSTTFNLPDSRGRASVNQSTDVEFTTIGQKTGSKTEALTIAQMPSHTHIQNPHYHIDGFAGVNPSATYGVSTSGPGNLNSQFGQDVNNHPITSATTATNQYTGGNGGHNNIQPSIVKMSAIKYAPFEPSAESLPAGTSIQGYWSAAPSTDYLLENGAAVSRATYAALFAVVGTTYGVGDGSTTFNLPDSRGRASVNLSPSDAEFNTMGEKYGTKVETITITTMPSHTHVQDAHNHISGFAGVNVNGSYGVSTSGSGNITSQGGTDTANHANTSSATATNQYTGGDGSHNNIQPSIVKLSAIKVTPATATGTDLVAGTSLQGYWTAAPTGYLPENGAAVSRATYAALFAVVGTTYGAGDGSTTFNLPDSRGRLAVNKNPSDTQFNTMGEKYGEKAHILTIAEMPSHTHIQNGHNHAEGFAGVNVNGSYGVVTVGAGNISNQGGTDTNNHAIMSSAVATNQNTGGGGAHNEIQPSIVKMFAIKF